MILEKIVAEKRKSLAELKKAVPLKKIEASINRAGSSFSFKEALSGHEIAIIAEVKKASPSKGLLTADFNPVALSRCYYQGGARAISVITEEKFFLGAPHYLPAVKQTVSLPILRKDFIIDPYQVYETAVLGGDALLLLAAVLDKNSLLSCLREAEGLNLACLVEIHNESELDMALTLGAEIVGINNRDLRTFETSSEVTKRLAPLIPSEILLVAESGIKTKSDLVKLASYGIDAALIGEALVTSHAPVELLQEFTGIRKRGFLHG